MSLTPITDVDEDENNQYMVKSPPEFKSYFQNKVVMGRSAQKEPIV